MANPRVHEIASELGIESKVVMAKLRSLGEFVRGPSSSIAPPVARKVKRALIDDGAIPDPNWVRRPPLTPSEQQQLLLDLLRGAPRSLPAFLDELVEGTSPSNRWGLLMRSAIVGRNFFYFPEHNLRSLNVAGAGVLRSSSLSLLAPAGIAVVGESAIIAWYSTPDRLHAVEMITRRLEHAQGSGLDVTPRNYLDAIVQDGLVIRPFPTGDLLLALAGLVAAVPFRLAAASRSTNPHAESTGENPQKLARDPVIRYLSRSGATERRSPADPVPRTSRWKVRGHWREQWYPSDQTHRRLWIEEHDAGAGELESASQDSVYVVKDVSG